jgi:hypothetical protein
MADEPKPTAAEVAKYKSLRDSGKSAVEATRIIRSDRKAGKR